MAPRLLVALCTATVRSSQHRRCLGVNPLKGAIDEGTYGFEHSRHCDVEQQLADDKWINRLVEFVNDRRRTNASRLTVALLEHVDVRLKALNDATSEGVHSSVTDAEVSQCVVQTYLVIGDILRLAEAS